MISAILHSVMSAVLIYDQSTFDKWRHSNTADYIIDLDDTLYLNGPTLHCNPCGDKASYTSDTYVCHHYLIKLSDILKYVYSLVIFGVSVRTMWHIVNKWHSQIQVLDRVWAFTCHAWCLSCLLDVEMSTSACHYLQGRWIQGWFLGHCGKCTNLSSHSNN